MPPSVAESNLVLHTQDNNSASLYLSSTKYVVMWRSVESLKITYLTDSPYNPKKGVRPTAGGGAGAGGGWHRRARHTENVLCSTFPINFFLKRRFVCIIAEVKVCNDPCCSHAALNILIFKC